MPDPKERGPDDQRPGNEPEGDVAESDDDWWKQENIRHKQDDADANDRDEHPDRE